MTPDSPASRIPSSPLAGSHPARSLLSLADVPPATWRRWIATADRFRQGGAPEHSPAKGRHVALCFFEPSTRTRISFERAARGLGACPYVLAADSSSLAKGESLRDTARTLVAAGLELLVLRHRDEGACRVFAEAVPVPVLNAGDGSNEHPTQALLDWLTLWRHFGRLAGLRILLVGDVKHSRVAHSLRFGKALGQTFGVAAPEALVDRKLVADFGAFEPSLDEALSRYDVVYVLRPQRERFATAGILDDATYRRDFGITAARAARLAPQARILTPGPVSANFEIDEAVVEDPSRSLVWEQVVNGTYLRMALLHGAFGGALDDGEAIR